MYATPVRSVAIEQSNTKAKPISAFTPYIIQFLTLRSHLYSTVHTTRGTLIDKNVRTILDIAVTNLAI